MATQKSVYFDEEGLRRIRVLARAGHTSETAVIRRAVDLLWAQEVAEIERAAERVRAHIRRHGGMTDNPEEWFNG